MDTVKMGQFLKELRKENGLTQEQLGAKIGVTNKTISRWENGNYIPPIECLSMLSDIYGISINEIVAGQKLDITEFVGAADDNLKGALELSEQSYKKSEKMLTTMFVISTLLAILIIILLPVKKIGIGLGLLLIGLIVILAFISNTVHVVALALNKEKYDSGK